MEASVGAIHVGISHKKTGEEGEHCYKSAKRTVATRNKGVSERKIGRGESRECGKIGAILSRSKDEEKKRANVTDVKSNRGRRGKVHPKYSKKKGPLKSIMSCQTRCIR